MQCDLHLWLLLRFSLWFFNSLTTVVEAGDGVGKEEHIGLFNSTSDVLVLRLGCRLTDVRFYNFYNSHVLHRFFGM